MLKMTGVEIDLIYDQEMYEMIEAGLRGGMCMVSTKKVEANNKCMGEEYDKNIVILTILMLIICTG